MNAIILAAGLGSRFGAITKDQHKALLSIDGIPNIERTIRYLKEAEIDDITIVTGHMAQLFTYLSERYGCTLIHNEHYAEFNNRYSFQLAAEKLSNTYVIDADVILLKNIFLQTCENSFYYTIQRAPQDACEWCPILDAQGFVKEMRITNEELPSMLGISYWNEAAAERIKHVLPSFLNESDLTNSRLYWDDIPVSLLPGLRVRTELVREEDAGEMDTWNQYIEICEKVEKQRGS